jgi:hypothetical protein
MKKFAIISPNIPHAYSVQLTDTIVASNAFADIVTSLECGILPIHLMSQLPDPFQCDISEEKGTISLHKHNLLTYTKMSSGGAHE